MVSVVPERTEHEARSRRLWLAVRRALLAICAAIEREYGQDKPLTG